MALLLTILGCSHLTPDPTPVPVLAETIYPLGHLEYNCVNGTATHIKPQVSLPDLDQHRVSKSFHVNIVREKPDGIEIAHHRVVVLRHGETIKEPAGNWTIHLAVDADGMPSVEVECYEVADKDYSKLLLRMFGR